MDCCKACLCGGHRLRLTCENMQDCERPRAQQTWVIALGDLAVRFPNILEPWTAGMYRVLEDPHEGQGPFHAPSSCTPAHNLSQKCASAELTSLHRRYLPCSRTGGPTWSSSQNLGIRVQA